MFLFPYRDIICKATDSSMAGWENQKKIKIIWGLKIEK